MAGLTIWCHFSFRQNRVKQIMFRFSNLSKVYENSEILEKSNGIMDKYTSFTNLFSLCAVLHDNWCYSVKLHLSIQSQALACICKYSNVIYLLQRQTKDITKSQSHFRTVKKSVGHVKMQPSFSSGHVKMVLYYSNFQHWHFL